MGALVLLLYNGIGSLLFPFLAPYLIYRLRRRGQAWEGIGQRFGLYSADVRERLREGTDLWVHAVSVGEVLLASVLLYHLRQRDPRIRVVLTTTTTTGRKVAQSLENERTLVLYNPVDLLWCVSRAFKTIRPKLFVLVEAEIWPNHLFTARRLGIPTCLLNARLSSRTERRYQLFHWFCRPVLAWLDLILAQHDSDVQRLVRAGFPPEAIFVAGSLKYDVADLPDPNGKAVDRWWRLCQWDLEKDRVLLGGSTHPGEEEVLLRVYQEIVPKHPNWKLVLAPRHAERAAAIREVCVRMGFRTSLRSELTKEGQDKGLSVLVLDSTGELRSLYEKADIVFVGKSLKARGGQNFIEAARAGKPILVGPYTENFSHLTVEFLSKGGITQVADEFELARVIQHLVCDSQERARLGKKARSIFESNLGAGAGTARILWELLQHVGQRPTS
jgi:3-deoxy-D-manno-octulosonic-acid transferase